MPGEFRIEVVSVERGGAGRARVQLRLEVPDGLEASVLNRQLAGFFAKELGSRVGVRLRRAPWRNGVRVERDGSVALSGLDAQGQVQLESHARESAEECNRDLQPNGQMGSRLHEIVRRLGPR